MLIGYNFMLFQATLKRRVVLKGYLKNCVHKRIQEVDMSHVSKGRVTTDSRLHIPIIWNFPPFNVFQFDWSGKPSQGSR